MGAHPHNVRDVGATTGWMATRRHAGEIVALVPSSMRTHDAAELHSAEERAGKWIRHPGVWAPGRDGWESGCTGGWASARRARATPQRCGSGPSRERRGEKRRWATEERGWASWGHWVLSSFFIPFSFLYLKPDLVLKFKFNHALRVEIDAHQSQNIIQNKYISV